MFTQNSIDYNNRKEFYNYLITCLEELINGEPDWLANISNAAALLYQLIPDINWAGFYFYKNGELVLGPFQGKPACIRIPMGKGVCGTAAKTREIQLVPDVNKFPGHIACDELSKSEIVLPIIKNERLIGVLDIDSPVLSRFDKQDADGLAFFVDCLNKHINWPEFV
ncbi:MAG: GAF domain-containing protein [Clostridiaceae bacterium]|nr:GAF domain-containing protein [Clostridiaceae bacterium]